MAKKYRVAVIGRTGRGDYGHELDVAWRDVAEAEIVAVADDDKMGLAAAAKRLGVDAAFADYREMLDKAKPDIVTIATRWIDQHRDMAVAAAERGIHIFMEKPLCRTLAEADQMVAACERTHAKLAVAFPTRYSPRVKKLQELLAGGAIGQVLEYRARGKEDARGGGEDLWVLGPHMLDLVRVFGGRPQWCFASVTKQGKPISRTDVVEGNEGIGLLAGDHVRAMYGLADGSTAYWSSAKNAAGKPSRYGLQIFGSRGMVEILEGTMPSIKYLPDASWSPSRSGAQWQEITSAGIGQPEPLSGSPYDGRHLLAIQDLLASIEDRQRQPLASVYEARDVTEMIVGVFASQCAGGPVSLPLAERENPLAKLS